MKQCYWLWYPGDFELYHAMRQNFSRVERGCQWPAFWKSASFRNRVVFRRWYELDEETSFTVNTVSGAAAYVQLDELKYPVGEMIFCPAGRHRLSVHIGCIGCVPSIYIEGDVICSDDGWMVEDYDAPSVQAARNRYFTDPKRDPSQWQYSEKLYAPSRVEEVNGGTLFQFETELTASLELCWDKKLSKSPTVYLGESRSEALDTVNCYYHCQPDPVNGRCERQALQFAYIPGLLPENCTAKAIHQYIEIPVKASFRCEDEELNRIFEVAAHTFMLCSGAFFLDGIKRDKWIWGGDAYQSMLVNRYLTADREIEKRTLIALRGAEPTTTHVNTILDYSLLWILSMEAYYDSYGDRAFIDEMWPKMESLMKLCMTQREEHGFLVGRERDWTFIDWADFDRDGPLCAEQMLLCEAYRVMEKLSPNEKGELYRQARTALLLQIEANYWDKDKNAYVDSFTSGRRHVTRHANIFAILFEIADDARKQRLVQSVLHNPEIPLITTPYFRFFELEVLCRMGFLEEVLAEIKRYWGGMLRLGAVTFWEEFDPEKPLEQQYEMYGDPYGKSLCHAWAASPIYLLARYYIGLHGITPGGAQYVLSPQKAFFRSLNCCFPMGQKQLHIRLEDNRLCVEEE